MSPDSGERLTATWQATMMVGPGEETLTLDLPDWMDRWDARDAFHAECMDVYDTRGVLLDGPNRI